MTMEGSLVRSSGRCGDKDLLRLGGEMEVGKGINKRVDWRLTLIRHRILFVQSPGIVEREGPSRVQRKRGVRNNKDKGTERREGRFTRWNGLGHLPDREGSDTQDLEEEKSRRGVMNAVGGW